MEGKAPERAMPGGTEGGDPTAAASPLLPPGSGPRYLFTEASQAQVQERPST